MPRATLFVARPDTLALVTNASARSRGKLVKGYDLKAAKMAWLKEPRARAGAHLLRAVPRVPLAAPSRRALPALSRPPGVLTTSVGRRTRRGDSAELLQHAEGVPVAPALDDRVVLEAIDLHAAHGGPLPGGRQPR